MNKVILLGRLTKDPEVRYTQSENMLAIARYTLAVDRRFKKEGQPSADFINCVAFGKSAEFAEKYMTKGRLFGVIGRIQTRNYDKKEKVYVVDAKTELEAQETANKMFNTDFGVFGENTYSNRYLLPENKPCSHRSIFWSRKCFQHSLRLRERAWMPMLLR